ncbi:MAG: tRNA (N(6)-L-threonylcarbamoyladenosine(37)-C(2))-methylthiotransferase MtaB [Crocinitomicaceae bacterium]|nr:tRNA (N(6)-L-threonylcarbamoyladenosine(37)-C(2))-methylthiotransferase MtaB [Crocinitomicaceae bacterium]MDP4800278.1 tRNA (N(6)-L-threonylcarbamoyladenosine(37)-C(2))-methylthiotransferase MtaB [Crocinitomicaceae bacterium]MDP4806613.1 tRNA (N(6)-L-threonylcarbamoyladenosine(37)-C(2))-methylthiotransferase MtaB [Crocinitomicaceae bacterium]MDP4868214.1 tRNA (N(6)-L-threonylcarbamoyladenosine(37)-C(2))-methylthiotransferase MtaB [Crocinitomicaceae bacterium]MDP5043317.1 tRNA (N(6)-L-threony
MNQFERVAFYTLGCKLNFSETSTIARLFEDGGFAKVDFEDKPDVFVINTCSVTENADKKCKQLVKRAKKISPESMVIILGCYAQLKPEEISRIPGVDLVLGANEKFNVLAHLEKKSEVKVVHDNIKHTHDFIPSHSYGDRTRSFLKVQDGCDYFCTFCTIPLARGKSRNASIAATVAEAQKIAQTAVKEVVLTGVNIGDFGQGGAENFFDLTKALDDVAGIERFRISSIEPNLLSDDIIDFCLTASKRFAPHFHIPLQSGSDDILEKMRRKYKTSLYAQRVERIKATNPDACIGVDVIVGFPGETDEDFLATVHFLKDLDISYLHVFTYSERANTGAPKLGTKVPMETRRERSKILHLLSDRKKLAFYQTQVGKQKAVLFEQEENEGWLYGFSENYVKVKTPYNEALINQIVAVELTEIDRDGLMKCHILTNFVS